jgi:hypothetical protein
MTKQDIPLRLILGINLDTPLAHTSSHAFQKTSEGWRTFRVVRGWGSKSLTYIPGCIVLTYNTVKKIQKENLSNKEVYKYFKFEGEYNA